MKNKLLCLFLAILMLIGGGCEVSPAAPDAPQTSAPVPTPSAQIGALATQPPEQTDLVAFSMLGLANPSGVESENDLLTPIWREMTGVCMDVVSIPESVSYEDYLSAAIVAGALPDVLALESGIFDVPARYDSLLQADLLWEIDQETARANMPLTAARLADMGIAFEDWYLANTDADTGLWTAVPALPSALYNEELRATRYGTDQADVTFSYIWLRDDILAEMQVSHLTEEGLATLYAGVGEALTYELAFDYSFPTLSSWLDYFESVHAYAVEYNYDLVPAHLTYDASAGSALWSLYGASGFVWTDMPEFVTDIPTGGTSFIHYTQTDGWRDYMQFLAACREKGYFGDDFAEISDSERTARVQKGGYSAVNGYLETEGVLASGSFGWRLTPVLLENQASAQGGHVQVLSLRTKGAVGFNKQSVTYDELCTLLSWVDWNYSQKAQQLRTWGEGLAQEGAARFASDYADVAMDMLSMTSAGDAAWKYGLVNVLSKGRAHWNHEVYGVGGGDVGAGAPFYAYDLREIPFDQEYLVPYLAKKMWLENAEYVEISWTQEKIRAASQLRWQLRSFKQGYVAELASVQDELATRALAAGEREFAIHFIAYQNAYRNSLVKSHESTLSQLLTTIFR